MSGMIGIMGALRNDPQFASVVVDTAREHRCKLAQFRMEARLRSQERMEEHEDFMESLPRAERQKVEESADNLPCMEDRLESEWVRRAEAQSNRQRGQEAEEYDDPVACENAILERLEHERAELEEQTHRKFRPLLIRGQEHQRIARYNQGDGAHQSRRNRGQKSLYKERRHSYSLPKYSLVGG